MQFDKHGRELPDSTPLAMPAGFTPPETLAEQIQRLVRTQVSDKAEELGQESFSEADDFEIEDDDEADPTSIFEQHFDPVLGRDVTAQQIIDDPNIKKEYEEAQLQLDQEEQRNPDEGASGVTKPPATPETPLPDQDKMPTPQTVL